MKAIIFAASKSPRLLPITKDLPISLLKIKDRKILDIQLEALNKFDFSEIIITTGFQAEQIEALKLPSNVKLFFNPFYGVSNIPATMYSLRDRLKEDCILIYGDVLFKTSVLEKLVDSEKDVTLAVDMTHRGEVDEEAEKVVVKNNLVSKLNKISINKESSDGEFIGLSKISSQTFAKKENILKKAIEKDLKISFINLLNLLIKAGQEINFVEVPDDSWTEIDFPDDLEKAQDF